MMNWKRFGSKKSWPNYKVLSRHSLGGTTENHDKINQDSLSPEPKSVPGRPEYERGSDVEQRSLYSRPAPGVRIIVQAKPHVLNSARVQGYVLLVNEAGNPGSGCEHYFCGV
jgi:hypothetical protein